MGFAGTAVAQQQTQEKQPERVKLIRSSESKPVQEKSETTTTKKVKTPAEELKACEATLEAINKKEAWIKENPEELKKAKAAGWFEDAAKTRESLTKRIEELKQTQK